jgi:hypothetical protein
MRLQLDTRLQSRPSSHMAIVCSKGKPDEKILPHFLNPERFLWWNEAAGTDANESTTNR